MKMRGELTGPTLEEMRCLVAPQVHPRRILEKLQANVCQQIGKGSVAGAESPTGGAQVTRWQRETLWVIKRVTSSYRT